METLKQVRNFLTLASELHFARAAEKLGISQAALSMEIRKLEKSVSCQLFDRSDRWQIRLTEAGQAYFQQIRDVPAMLENAKQSALRASRGETGNLSIVVANAVYDSLNVGEIFKSMYRKFPAVKMKIQDRLSSPQAAELVRSGQCDAGIMAYIHGSSTVEGLRSLRIMDTPMCFAFPKNHPLSRKAELKVEDLANVSFISPPKEEAPLLRKFFEDFFQTHCRCIPDIAHEAVGLRAIRQLVSAGLGVALIPHDKDDGNIVYRKVPGGPRRSIIALWDGNNHSPALRNFLSLIPVHQS